MPSAEREAQAEIRPGRLDQIFRRIDQALLVISNLALTIILATICLTVWTRYVMRSPVSWAEDITSTAFAWFIFIGMAAVHNRQGHVGIDVVVTALPEGGQRWVKRFGDLFVACFCACTAYLCGLQAVVSHTTAQTTVLHIPLSVVFASLAIGFGLMAFRSVGFLLGVPPIPAEE